ADVAAVDEDVVDHRQADARWIAGVAARAGRRRRIGALVKDELDALDSAARRDRRDRLGRVGRLEAHSGPLQRILLGGRWRRIVRAAADEGKAVAATWQRVRNVEAGCAATAMAA